MNEHSHLHCEIAFLRLFVPFASRLSVVSSLAPSGRLLLFFIPADLLHEMSLSLETMRSSLGIEPTPTRDAIWDLDSSDY